ncbi:ABC transporter ATP-binding protein [Desulfogranum japonicum]|uniref:ABC transporter ATP-binding protein n=1 Tax=Desulfogranum japonicum TaxID=231447 RepID=UPI00040F9B37|nr:ABC transporter ATP-binding protein [Desulfogranum japonicum]
MKLLELTNVNKTYHRGGWFVQRDNVEALSDVSLTVEEQCSVGVIGRSGAGKSTLGRLILGLERPNGGNIRYRDKDMMDFSRSDWRRFRREVQVVFQNAQGSVNPRWQVFDIIAEPIRNNQRLSTGELEKKIDQLLQMVGLDPQDKRKYAHQFSGGQLQRVCIARALSIEPKLIVLDEAVSSLDMLIQAQILALLRELQRQTHVSYLFISHDIRIVAGFCDKVVVLDGGRVSSHLQDISCAEDSENPVVRELAHAILPAWPQAAG